MLHPSQLPHTVASVLLEQLAKPTAPHTRVNTNRRITELVLRYLLVPGQRRVQVADAVQWLQHRSVVTRVDSSGAAGDLQQSTTQSTEEDTDGFSSHHAAGSAKPLPPGCSLVASLPDWRVMIQRSAVGPDIEAWKRWFVNAAKAVMDATPDDGVSVFFQTDVIHRGVWIDKAFLCQLAAEQCNLMVAENKKEESGDERKGMNSVATDNAIVARARARPPVRLLWHKVVCRQSPGVVVRDGTAGYSHLLCFSRNTALWQSGDARWTFGADVVGTTGQKAWAQGMGSEVCRMVCAFLMDHVGCKTVVNPFCGQGSLLAVANAMGMHGLGVEINKHRARTARKLQALYNWGNPDEDLLQTSLSFRFVHAGGCGDEAGS